jgi:hypothetical protein
MHRLFGRASSVGLLACVILTACGAEDERRATPRPSASPSSSDSGQLASAACRKRHAAVARGYAFHLSKAIDMVTHSATGTSRKASHYLGAMLDRAASKVDAECQEIPESLATFEQQVQDHLQEPLDRQGQRRLVTDYARWGSPLGASDRVEKLEYKLALCREYDRGIHASYSVHEARAADGKRMWVDWTVHNETDRRVVVGQAGALWARGVRRGYYGEWDRKKKAWLYTWGASSADPEVSVEPGTSETTLAAVGPGYLPMRDDGTILGADPEVWVARRSWPNFWGFCSVHASREP